MTPFVQRPDGSWGPAQPLPYFRQRRPSWWKRALMLTFFRRYKCRRVWCGWPATEVGFCCDRHGAMPSGVESVS